MKIYDRNTWSDIVNGKRVCLTGSSKSIDLNPAGFIDSFDVVLRTNLSWCSTQELRENIGHKIDIVYLGRKDGTLAFELFKQLKISQPVQYNNTSLNYHKIKYINHELKEDLCIARNNESIFEFFKNQNICNSDDLEFNIWKFQSSVGLKKRPSCGLFAAWNLLQTNLTQLYITGISFYNEVYKQGHALSTMGDDQQVHRTNPNHDSRSDEDYFFKTLYPEQSDRILLDPTLQKLYRDYLENSIDFWSKGKD